mgnify:CR=1 FL=1
MNAVSNHQFTRCHESQFIAVHASSRVVAPVALRPRSRASPSAVSLRKFENESERKGPYKGRTRPSARPPAPRSTMHETGSIRKAKGLLVY